VFVAITTVDEYIAVIAIHVHVVRRCQRAAAPRKRAKR